MNRLSRVFLIGALLSQIAEAQLPPLPQTKETGIDPTPKLRVIHRKLDLGVVLEGDIKRATWVLENQGTADLLITGTRSSCGCTVVKLSEEEKTIKPGGTLELNADFNSTGRKNQMTKSITVHSNDPDEPKITLSFDVIVEALYEATPTKLVNLRSVRRGQQASQTIDILPAPNHQTAELIAIETPDLAPIRHASEPLSSPNGNGIRVKLTVDETAAVGALSTDIRIKFRVDGVERELIFPVRATVVGDLTWIPLILDATRKQSPPGYRLAPVTIRSSNDVPFRILSASADPCCDVTFDTDEPGKKELSEYTLFLTLRDSAATGPFGTTLDIRTNLLDQPIIRIPVFGDIAPPITVEPPIVLLRRDGTQKGSERRIKLQVLPQVKLDISAVVCNHAAIEAEIDMAESKRYGHIRFLKVRLNSEQAVKEREAVIVLTTNIAGAETIEIPVTIDIPGD